MSKNVVKEGVRNSFYVLLSQTINLILGVIRSVLLPILLGVVNFGYWQVYLLFLSFAGAFGLGINDGIYLRYGKHSYEELPHKKLRTMIYLFIIIQVIIVSFLLFLVHFETGVDRRDAIQWAIINIPIMGLTGVLSCIIQTTNQLKKFSFFATVDKFLVLVLVLFILLFKFNNYRYIIYADTFSRFCTLLLLIFSCKELIFGKLLNLKEAFKEVWLNFKVGIKVMIANLTGMLILTFGVLYVELNKPIEIYSVYSFSTSTMALVLILVGALGMVIYPTLSRIEENKYPRYYLKMNKVLNVFVYFIMFGYYPLVIFISFFMPKYVGLFPYLPIIFGIIIIQSKMHILINPYYKLLREEKKMLYSNVTGVLIAIGLVVLSFQIFKSEIAVAGATFVAMLYRILTMEKYLFNRMKITKSVINCDVFFIFCFIACAYIPIFWMSLIVYIICFIVYCYYRLIYVGKKYRKLQKK